MTKRETILERVTKLLATAEHPNTNVEEAATAAALAAKLVLKHNIEDAELERTGKRQKDAYVCRYVKHSEGKQFEMLLNAIAKANFCQMLHWKTFKTSGLVGQPQNIEVTIYLFEVTKREINRLCKQAYDPRHGKWNAHWTGFWYGAIQAIWERLDAQRKGEREGSEGEDARALVVVKDAEIADAVRALVGAVGEAKGKSVKLDGFAWASGYAAGKSIPLHPAVAGSAAESS